MGQHNNRVNLYLKATPETCIEATNFKFGLKVTLTIKIKFQIQKFNNHTPLKINPLSNRDNIH